MAIRAEREWLWDTSKGTEKGFLKKKSTNSVIMQSEIDVLTKCLTY